MPRGSFRNKLIAGALAPLVIAGALQALYSVVSQRREAVAVLEAKVHALASLLVNVAGPSIALDDPSGVNEALGHVEHDPDFEFALAVTPDGKPIAFRGPPSARDAAIAGAAITREPVVSERGETMVASYPVVIRGKPIAQLVVGLRTSNASAHAARRTAWAALISIAGIAAAAAVVLALAGRIARRNREMTELLDNLDQACLGMRRDGTLAVERSAMAMRLLGAHRPGQRLWEAIAPHDRSTAAWLELSWASVLDGAQPLEIALDQLPDQLAIGDRSYRIEYKPTIVDDKVASTLVVITDRTAELARERAEALERDLLRMVERLTRDRPGFAAFVAETDRLIQSLDRASDSITDAVRRDLRALEARCATFGLAQIAERCRELEERLAITSRLDGNVVHGIVAGWGELKTRLDRVLGARHATDSEIAPDDLAELQAAIARGASLGMIEYIVRSWSLERTRARSG